MRTIAHSSLPMRECVKCHETKPIYEFMAVPFTWSGFDVKCSECAKEDMRKWKEHTRGGDDESESLLLGSLR